MHVVQKYRGQKVIKCLGHWFQDLLRYSEVYVSLKEKGGTLVISLLEILRLISF